MGTSHVTPARTEVPERGEHWIIRRPRQGSAAIVVDVLAAMDRLYYLWRRCGTTERAERVLRGIRRLGDDVTHHDDDACVDVRRRGVAWRWTQNNDGCRTLDALRQLETLAHVVLAAAPVDGATYRRWADEGDSDDADLVSGEARSDLPRDVAECVHPLMTFYRRSQRAVGPYWLLPFLYLLLHDRVADDWSEGGAYLLLERAPAAGVAVHYWPPWVWRPRRSAVRYLWGYQEQVICATADGDAGLDSGALYLLTVGGQPTATAVVRGTGHWGLALLRGHRRIGSAALLLRHLQALASARGVSGIAAVSAADHAARGVLEAHGFRCVADGDRFWWDA